MCTECCAHGFPTTQGWDLTTGLGTVDFEKMQTHFMQLGSSQSSHPSVSPTVMLMSTFISVSQVRLAINLSHLTMWQLYALHRVNE